MGESTLTHKNLAALLGVSETTVKSYRRKFPGCIPVANKGKPIRFTQDAAKVATRIRDLFATGMSVEEVRARLAADFAWITPESAAPLKEDDRSSVHAEHGPGLSLGVSNMAKSLVAMTQQQKAILSRIQGVESRLEGLGAEDMTEVARKQTETLRHKEYQLGERLATLDKLDDMVTTLAESVKELSGRLDSLLARREKAAAEWGQNGQETMAASARLRKETCTSDQPPAHEPARVVPLRQSAPQSASAPLPGNEPKREPERRLFSLPLVARTEQGQFISAGGKNRGHFSLNDLKAMLIYGFAPPNNFTLRFEAHGNGWWLNLDQASGKRRICLLLMELPTQRGSGVVEILQITNNGDKAHPTEICGIVDSFSA